MSVTSMIFFNKKLCKGYLLCIFCFQVLTHVLDAQPENWTIRYYSTEEGLSSNHINCILKDSKGFIWAGADNGLNRFDGYSFSLPGLSSGTSHPLTGVQILSMIEDRDSILWIGTSDGLFRYNTSNPISEIKQYNYLPVQEGKTFRMSQPVNDLCEDKNGLLWMSCIDIGEGVNYGLWTFNKTSETFSYVIPDSTYSFRGAGIPVEGYIGSVYSDRNGDLWMGSESGLYNYDFAGDSFRKFVPAPGSQLPGANMVARIYEDRFGNLWTTGLYGMASFDRETERFGERVILDIKKWNYGDQSLTYTMKEDRNGYCWLRINENLVRTKVAPSGQFDLTTMEHWETDYTTLEINPTVSLLVEDPWNVWLAVSDRGLCHVTLRRNRFKTLYPLSILNIDADLLQYIASVYHDQQTTLWMSIFGGASIQYEQKSGNAAYFFPIPAPFAMINGMTNDQYENLWFTTLQGIHSRMPASGTSPSDLVVYYPDSTDPASLIRRNEFYAVGKGSTSTHLYEHIVLKDRYDTLWFNSGRGIHDRYDPDLDGFIHLDHRNIDSYNNEACYQAEMEGEIWFPLQEGLLRLLPPFAEAAPFTVKPWRTILYQYDPKEKNCLNSSWIRSILFSEHFEAGTLWIGTVGGGLNKMVQTPVEGTETCQINFRHYTEEDGLCNNTVLGILEDENGNLWLSTLNGLSKFDPRTGIFNNFYELDGLPTNHFSWADPCKAPSGEMYFPTEDGVLTFFPDSIQINTEVPPVAITEFKVLNKSNRPGSDFSFTELPDDPAPIKLKYKQNFLSFEFSALNFEQPEKNQYKYMLENLDPEWIYAGGRRYVEYTDLRSGTYTFRVQGSNNNGMWNLDGATLSVIIRPPPWLSWWAYVIYSMIVAGIIAWYRKYLLNRAKLRTSVEVERLEKEKLREMDQLRTRFFANISHEFRTPLTLILGPAENALRSKKENITAHRSVFESIRESAGRLLQLVNQLLDISKLESDSLKLQVTKGDLAESIKPILLSYISLAESKQIIYTHDLLQTSFITWFDLDKVHKIIGNLITNAIKYTPEGGTVNVSIRYLFPSGSDLPERVELKVDDSGPGISPEAQDKIFDRFYQVNDSGSGGEGTGIGLALVKELVDLYRGEITLKSEPGLGSSFTVRLPVLREQFNTEEINIDPETAIEPASQVEVEPGDFGNEIVPNPNIKSAEVRTDFPLILIVEDNLDLSAYISGILADQYRILTAENGSMGLEVAKENIPDLIISDLMMPVMDGVEMCGKIREDRRTDHIPVILLTARADRESKLEGLETGADEYIIKPFDEVELKTRVRNLILQREKLRAHFQQDFLLEDHGPVFSTSFSMLKEAMSVIDRHLEDPDFHIKTFSEELNMSRSQLFRKIENITGTTPNELIRMVRMKRAAQLLRAGALNVTQVMYQVGMTHPSHFASSFKKYYGVNPSEYKNHRG